MTGQAPSIGTRIKRARKRVNGARRLVGQRPMTQQELAGLVGASRASINRYERGQVIPPEDVLIALGEVLGEDFTACPQAAQPLDPSLLSLIDAMSPGQRAHLLELLLGPPDPPGPGAARHRRAG